MNAQSVRFSLIVCVVLLIACKGSSKPEILYEIERVSLDGRNTEFREWAQNLIAIIAENNRDLETTVALVEKEYQQDLSSVETEQFNMLQRRIQDRNNQISRLFDSGQKLQIDLFTGFYQYLGKLDSGAQYCGLDDIDSQENKLLGLVNQSAWPQLEDSYRTSFDEGTTLLQNNQRFPCNKFLPTYQTLKGEIETKIDSINQLLKSLNF